MALPPNFMGLYAQAQGAPQAAGAQAPAAGFPQLNSLYGMGAMPYSQPAAPLAGHPTTADPWAMLQPKLDAYMAAWQKKNAAAPYVASPQNDRDFGGGQDGAAGGDGSGGHNSEPSSGSGSG